MRFEMDNEAVKQAMTEAIAKALPAHVLTKAIEETGPIVLAGLREEALCAATEKIFKVRSKDMFLMGNAEAKLRDQIRAELERGTREFPSHESIQQLRDQSIAEMHRRSRDDNEALKARIIEAEGMELEKIIVFLRAAASVYGVGTSANLAVLEMARMLENDEHKEWMVEFELKNAPETATETGPNLPPAILPAPVGSLGG